MSYDKALDTSGLSCPQVLLKAKKVLASMEKGEVLKVISTDPSSVLDFKVFAVTQSHDLIKTAQRQKQFIFWIKK